MKKTQKPASAGKEAQAQAQASKEAQKPQQKGKKGEAQPASKGTMEKPIWESGKRSVKISGKRYSRKAYQTARKLGLALGDVTEGGFWAIVHKAKAQSGEEAAKKRMGATNTLSQARENKRELAASQKEAQGALKASPLYGALIGATAERKAYIALTKEQEKRLTINEWLDKGYDYHSAEAKWEEKEAKRAKKAQEAQEKREREERERKHKEDLEAWERIQKEKAQREREEARKQAQAQKPASKGGGKAPSKQAANRA